MQSDSELMLDGSRSDAVNSVPRMMLAARYRQYGPPSVLSVVSIDVPDVGEDEVLVKVHASTVNRTDCGFLRGKPFVVRFVSGLFSPKDEVLGCEFAGEVVKVGEQVQEFNLGDRVFGFKDDDFGFGGHAEYTTMSVKGMIAKIPDGLGYQQAAPGMEGSHYALSGIRAAKIGPEHSVLVNGGTGAIGSAAIQLIKQLGASVTAVCAREHFELVRALGADQLVDYQTEDFTQLDDAFDIVFDAVGKSTLRQSARVLKVGGIYLSTELGPWCQNPFLALWTRWFGKHRLLFPIPINRRTDAEYLRDLMANNQFQPLVDRTYSLDEIIEAYEYVETGMKIGNVVLRVR